MEQMTREEAVQFLTKQQDLFGEAASVERVKQILRETGKTVGYAPAFRCLVMDLEPEESIRWGK